MVWVFFLKSPRLDINQSNCVAQDYMAQDKLPSSQACFLTYKMIGLDLMIFRVGHIFSCPVFVLNTTRHLSKQLRVRPISSNLSVFLEIYYSFGFHVSSVSWFSCYLLQTFCLSLSFMGSSLPTVGVCHSVLELRNSSLYTWNTLHLHYFKIWKLFFSLLHCKIFKRNHAALVSCLFFNNQCLTRRKIKTVYWIQQNGLWFYYFQNSPIFSTVLLL